MTAESEPQPKKTKVRTPKMALQIISNAIDRSISQNEIVTLESDEIARAGNSVEAVCSELFAECEDSTDADTVTEYWGKDIDGNEWRVHVTR